MEIDDFARVVRSAIEHEDNVSSQRLTWLFLLQGFLINAFVGLLKLRYDQLNLTKHPNYGIEALLFSLAIFGIASCISAWGFGVRFSSIARDTFRKIYTDKIVGIDKIVGTEPNTHNKPDNHRFEFEFKDFQDDETKQLFIGFVAKQNLRFLHPFNILPWLLIIFWGIIIVLLILGLFFSNFI